MDRPLNPADLRTHHLRFLHLEDSPADAELIRGVLEAEGFTVDMCHVSTRDEFTRLLSGQAFDMILSDYSLPGFNGMAALELAQERVPDLPFLFVTGTMGEDVATEALKGGATDYVLKHQLSRLPRAVLRAREEYLERRRRSRAEQALAQEQHILREVVDGAMVGIAVFDMKARIVLQNRVMEAMGFSDSPLPLENWVRHFGLYRPDGMTPLSTEEMPLLRALNGDRVQDFELIVRPAGGPARSYLASGHPLSGKDGNRIGAVLVMADVTERKALEKQFLQSQKMEVVGRLAGGVAHDFNNILTVIRGFSELVLRDGGLDPEMRESLEEVIKASQRAASLTRKLLAFSRQEAIIPRIVNLKDIIEDSGRMLQRLIGADIELKMQFGAMPPVHVDPGHMEQILVNLVVNARDAMPDGGCIVIETLSADIGEEDRLLHNGLDPGPYAVLAVSDTGTGMAPDVLARVFEPFFTTKEQGKGTGLGLATVFGIVKRYKGDILVYSEPGHGSSFKIFLPCAAASSSQPIPPQVCEVDSGGAEVILIVEDEESLRRLARIMLAKRGYTVHEACDGADALRVLDSLGSRVDLVVADIVMPGGMNGPDLVARIRRKHPDIAVVFMSGYAEQAVVDRGMVENASCFVSKPFSAEQLALTVRRALEKMRKAA